MVHSMQGIKKNREDLLKEAGIMPQGLEKGVGLAIKADLNLP